MRKIRILNIVPDIYTEGIAVSVKDRQALAAALKEETGGLVELESRIVEGGSESIEMCIRDSTIVILFASLAILGWQYVGCGETIGGALGIDPKIAMLLVGVVVTAYVVFGGIWAATATDVIQFSWVFIIQFIILPTFLIAKYGLPDAVALPDAFLSLPFGTLPVIKFVAPSVITFLMMHQSLLNLSLIHI